jgi:2-polyprenyl-3-methyl-5-hydroxy-6-metoxy-1,4-benzoquinol methylase
VKKFIKKVIKYIFTIKLIKKTIKYILKKFGYIITTIPSPPPPILHSEIIDNEESNISPQFEYSKYSIKELFLKQYRNSNLNRADIVVRYLAIEQYYGKNDYGFDLYLRMQDFRIKNTNHSIDRFISLIRSIEFNGFSDDDPITVMNNYELFDGSHRFATALFFGIDFVSIKKMNNIEEIQYGYDFLQQIFSANEIEIIKSKEKEIVEFSLKYINFRDRIYNIFNTEKQQFGRGNFYQSFEKLQIHGQRPTEFRFFKYGLDKYLDKEYEVLDIGCNCGFFSLYVSEYVRHIDGIEFNNTLIDIADITKNYLGINNCSFYCKDFKNFFIQKKYDVIFSFAVHYWIDMPMVNYSEKLSGLIKENGLIFFESQNIETIDNDYDKLISEFCSDKFIVLHNGEIMDDKNILRKFTILTPISANLFEKEINFYRNKIMEK